MTDPVAEFVQTLELQLDQLKVDPAVTSAASAIADAIASDRGYFLFGSGHSALVAHEAYWRAGGLAPALPITDPMGGDAERLEGMGAILLARYDLHPGDVLIVISHSGINCLPVEVALEAKAKGLTVIAITSLEHSLSLSSRHPGGKKLMDVADIVVDTHGKAGDAEVDLGGGEFAGATSTIVGAAIIEAITVKAAALLKERGVQPPLLVSSNIQGGDEHNLDLARRYRNRLVRCEIPGVDTRPGSTEDQ